MTLDDKDKDKFLVWLEGSAKTSKGMVEQFESLPSDPVMEEIIKREKMKMAAYLIVAEDLKSWEAMTLK